MFVFCSLKQMGLMAENKGSDRTMFLPTQASRSSRGITLSGGGLCVAHINHAESPRLLADQSVCQTQALQVDDRVLFGIQNR